MSHFFVKLFDAHPKKYVSKLKAELPGLKVRTKNLILNVFSCGLGFLEIIPVGI